MMGAANYDPGTPGMRPDRWGEIVPFGFNADPIYNTTNYPIRLTKERGNWDLYGNAKGYCAAIATKNSCRSSQFGDRDYFRGHVSRMTAEQKATLTLHGIQWSK
jgi:hypothetical protein